MDDLDRILSGEPLLEPSPGFSGRVMAAVRREAAAPRPVPFPWVRFAAGLGVAWGMVLVAIFFALAQAFPASAAGESVIDWAGFGQPLQNGLAALPLGWKLSAAAILFSLLVVPVSLRFASVRR